MINKKAGYLVLRIPKYNFDELGRGAYLPYPPKIKDLYYSGIDRMQWFDIDEDFYNRSLPDELIEKRNIINQNLCDMKLCDNLHVAELLLKYSNKLKNRNELMTIYSGTNIESAEFEDGLLGYDLCCEGYGSIIREGVFSKPDLFRGFITELNDYGLFNLDNELISSYCAAYEKESSKGIVEPIIGTVKKVALCRQKK